MDREEFQSVSLASRLKGASLKPKPSSDRSSGRVLQVLESRSPGECALGRGFSILRSPKSRGDLGGGTGGAYCLVNKVGGDLKVPNSEAAASGLSVPDCSDAQCEGPK